MVPSTVLFDFSLRSISTFMQPERATTMTAAAASRPRVRRFMWDSLASSASVRGRFGIFHPARARLAEPSPGGRRARVRDRVECYRLKSGEPVEQTSNIPLDRIGTRQAQDLSLIHISEPTRLGMISYAVF